MCVYVVRVTVTLPHFLFFSLSLLNHLLRQSMHFGPVTCALMYFTTAQRERRVSCKEFNTAFIPRLSERGGVEKREGEYQCVIVCVQDCVRVFREDSACFPWVKHVPARSFFEGNGEVLCFVLSVLCPRTRGVQDTRDCIPLCLRCCNRPLFS